MEQRLIDANAYAAEMKTRQDALKELMDDADALDNWEMYDGLSRAFSVFVEAKLTLDAMPTVDAVPVPDGGIGELSDGYHTFNGLYYQRMMLFAALVKTYKERAWKSRRHSDGEPCFGGGWFIVGIDTPHGGFTYHYEDKYFDLFDCVELPNGKDWDGHTEDDVTRLLTLDAVPVTHGEWIWDDTKCIYRCSICNSPKVRENMDREAIKEQRFCYNCGARMIGEQKRVKGARDGQQE